MPVIYIVFALNDVIAPTILQQMGSFTKARLKHLLHRYSSRHCSDSTPANSFFHEYLYHVEPFFCIFSPWLCGRYSSNPAPRPRACASLLLRCCLLHRYCQHILSGRIYDKRNSRAYIFTGLAFFFPPCVTLFH